ncbi:MAG: insulinase family protein [Acidimicrobiia bacterium]|nr:insulinase family protein [Acidimicrobiia bacterium]
MHYELSTLPNGLRVITQDMPSVHSATIGAWVDTGSRDETVAEAGCSHFLEHLLFKGSDQMTAHEIAEGFDAIGARHNAFTSKEYTVYWAKLRAADLGYAVDVFGEMLRRPAFRQEEIDSERHVVLEEINMNEDDPTDVAHELFVRKLWAEHPLSPPILGTRDSITGMARDTIAGYWERRYTPKSIVIAAAGRIDHQKLVAMIGEAFSDWAGDEIDRDHVTSGVPQGVSLRNRDTEQAHLVLGNRSLKRSDERRWAADVVDHVLGSGMSSRLFREVREQRGLAYAVHSFRLPFAETGANAIYVGTTPTQAPEVLKLIRSELDKIVGSGLTQQELDRAKGHVRGSLALSLEDSNSRMSRLGRNELTGMPHLSIDEVMERIDAVTLADTVEAAKAMYSGPFVLGAVGPFEPDELESYVA